MSRLILPGLIDVHVHLRDPGATQKEDYDTGTRAALKGGYTYVLDMPNNPTPTIDMQRLVEKARLVEEKAHCFVGFHYGTNGRNTSTFEKAIGHHAVYGLKLYCNHTTGEMLLEDLDLMMGVFEAWETEKPLLVHAEGTELAASVGLAQVYNRRLHVCHITQKEEVELVRRAKDRGVRISAGVCPHHLFLTGEARDTLGSRAIMKPPLGTKEDQDALWAGLRDGTIDIVETDHAPHTMVEKAADTPPYGVPGLETALPLMYRAVDEGRVEEAKIRQWMCDTPRALFGIPEDESRITLDTGTFVIGEDGYESKCGWSPFEGWEVPVRIKQVMWKGQIVVEDGAVVK